MTPRTIGVPSPALASAGSDVSTATAALVRGWADPAPVAALVQGWTDSGAVAITHPAGMVLGLAWAALVAVVAAGALGRPARRLPRPDDDHPDITGLHGTARGDRRMQGPAVIVQRAVGRLGAGIRGALTPFTGRLQSDIDVRASVDAPVGLTRAAGDHPIPDPDRDPTHDPIQDPTDDPEESLDRRIGWAALASGFLLLVTPALAAAPVTWAVAAPVLAARRGHARHESALVDQLPDVVDLLALTAAAGLPVAAALVAIDRRPGGPLGAGVGGAADHVRRGGSTAEGLARLATVGPAVRPLVDALVQHDRYGTPLLPALERVGIEARARRRRRSEEAARRLPVTLLFPLVLTTFPAFVLLTVVPLLAGSLGSLSLSPT